MGNNDSIRIRQPEGTMRFANIVTILSVALATAGGGAVAQEPPPPAREAQALPIKPDPSKLKKPVTKRRSAQQRIERMPIGRAHV